MKYLAALKILLTLNAWRKSRTLKTVGAGMTFSTVDLTMFDGRLAHAGLLVFQEAFNYVSPLDLSENQAACVLLFIMSTIGAVLRADTHTSLKEN